MRVPQAIGKTVWGTDQERTLNALKDAVKVLGDTIDTVKRRRFAAEGAATRDFRGFFADVFTRNCGVARGDADHLKEAAESLQRGLENLARAAQAEQKRIDAANKFVEKHKKWQREADAAEGFGDFW